MTNVTNTTGKLLYRCDKCHYLAERDEIGLYKCPRCNGHGHNGSVDQAGIYSINEHVITPSWAGPISTFIQFFQQL